MLQKQKHSKNLVKWWVAAEVMLLLEEPVVSWVTRVGRMMMTAVLLLQQTDVMRKDFLTFMDDKWTLSI